MLLRVELDLAGRGSPCVWSPAARDEFQHSRVISPQKSGVVAIVDEGDDLLDDEIEQVRPRSAGRNSDLGLSRRP